MNKISTIGLCIGCNRRDILDGGVCNGCLTGPKRGRNWATMMHKCRTNPDYAQTIYDSIETEQGKKLFVMLFGSEVITESDKLTTITRIH
jgi:hypothetical protein